MSLGFLVHDQQDNVGVAVADLVAGRSVAGGFREGGGQLEVTLLEPIPLGHKIALTQIPDGSVVTEYGVAIGVATSDIETGQLVHTHNLKGQRWA